MPTRRRHDDNFIYSSTLRRYVRRRTCGGCPMYLTHLHFLSRSFVTIRRNLVAGIRKSAARSGRSCVPAHRPWQYYNTRSVGDKLARCKNNRILLTTNLSRVQRRVSHSVGHERASSACCAPRRCSPRWNTITRSVLIANNALRAHPERIKHGSKINFSRRKIRPPGGAIIPPRRLVETGGVSRTKVSPISDKRITRQFNNGVQYIIV